MGEMMPWSEGESVVILVQTYAPNLGELIQLYVPAEVSAVFDAEGFVRIGIGADGEDWSEFDFFMSDVDFLIGDRPFFHFEDATSVQ